MLVAVSQDESREAGFSDAIGPDVSPDAKQGRSLNGRFRPAGRVVLRGFGCPLIDPRLWSYPTQAELGWGTRHFVKLALELLEKEPNGSPAHC